MSISYLNYSRSAPGIEKEGAKRIFDRSEETVVHFYGDGDSKSFKEVENIYPGEKMIKYECIVHCQKRVDNRLRLKRNTMGLGVTIDKLQNYFALRSSSGDIQKMKTAILARRVCFTLLLMQNIITIHTVKDS